MKRDNIVTFKSKICALNAYLVERQDLVSHPTGRDAGPSQMSLITKPMHKSGDWKQVDPPVRYVRISNVWGACVVAPRVDHNFDTNAVTRFVSDSKDLRYHNYHVISLRRSPVPWG